MAGDILRSKTQFKALDETAVFGRAYRHGFPKQFLNLKYGERYIFMPPTSENYSQDKLILVTGPLKYKSYGG